MQTSTSLEYEPSSEPLRITAKQLLLWSGDHPRAKPKDPEALRQARKCVHLPTRRKEAWPFYRTSSGVRLCWELEEPKGPKERQKGARHIQTPKLTAQHLSPQTGKP